MADLLHPGHPLMHSATDLVLEAHRSKLKQGAILVDPNDDGVEPRVLFMIDHSLRQSVNDTSNKEVTVSRRLQFVEINQQGEVFNAGWAPHLDLQPIGKDDLKLIQDVLDTPWLQGKSTNNLDASALKHASMHLVPEHYSEVKTRREGQVDKIHAAVRERLIGEINHWSGRYIKLTEDVAAGKQPRVQPEMAKRRYEELTARLEQRENELKAMRSVVSNTPVVIGGSLVIPQGMLSQRKGESGFTADATARARIERIAMQAVIDTEKALGHRVKDVSAEKCGWDITAVPPKRDGSLADDRHIEVKGRAKGQSTITVSRNEIIYGLNQTDKFILAIVIVDGNTHEGPFYIKQPFSHEPDFEVASVNYSLDDLLSKAIEPEATV